AAAWKLPRRTMRSNARSWPRVTYMIGQSYRSPLKKSAFSNVAVLLTCEERRVGLSDKHRCGNHSAAHWRRSSRQRETAVLAIPSPRPARYSCAAGQHALAIDFILEKTSMSTLSRRHFIAGLGAGATLAATGRHAYGADPITLKFATNDTTQDVSYAIAQSFGAEVAKRTNDKYRVQVFVGGSLGSGVNVVSSLQTGIIDCAILTSGFLSSVVPSIQIVDLPFLFKDRATAERILDGEVGKKIFAEADSRNIVGLRGAGTVGGRWRRARRR